MSQSITGSQTTVQTLTSANATIAASASVIANGKLGTFSVNNNGTLTPESIYGAVFAPTSLGAVTIHNLGLVDANGPTSLGPYDGGIVIGATGTLFNTGIIKGNSAVAMFGTTGSDYVSNTKLIAGSYGVGLYLAGNAKISNSGTIIGTSGTHVNASGIEIRGLAFVTNAASGTIASVGADALGLDNTGTVINAGLITGDGAGINFRNGGFASNASTGTIDGARIGIGLYSGGTIINAGHINNTGTSAIVRYSYEGIYLGPNGYVSNPVTIHNTIINTGTILGTDYGIDVLAESVTITNSGLIASTAQQVTFANNNSFVGFAAAIELSNTATVTNQAGGSIIGYNGIFLGNGGLVTNAGLISGSLAASGIFLSYNGSVINTGSIRAQHGAGIYGYDGFFSITNGGQISADYGVALGNGSGFIANNSTILGARQGIAQGQEFSGNATIINSGLIDGAATIFAGEGKYNGQTLHGVGIGINGGFITNTTHGTIIAGGDGIIAYKLITSINNAGTIIGSNDDGILLDEGGSVINSDFIQSYGNAIRASNASLQISNSGTIITTGSQFSAIYSQFGGSVTNAAGGFISAYYHGVYLSNGTSEVVSNSGTIIGTGKILTPTEHAGVGIGIYASVSNVITNAATGRIIGTNYGVVVGDAAGTIINAGSIVGYSGIFLGSPGFVSNAGLISGSRGGSAIFLANGGTIINFGTIRAQNAAAIYANAGLLTVTNSGLLTGDYAVNLGYGGALTNSGTIMVNKGAIGETIGTFDINSTNFTINNSGVIDVLGNTVTGDGRFVNETFIAPGVQLIGGTVTNQSHGTIISGGDGITAYFAAASINNAGTIIGAGEYGIVFGATGTVINTGLISGYREAIRDKSATATIINSGTIIATGNTFVIAGATSSSNGFATGTYISHGIQLTKGGTVINEAGGTISGQTAIDLKGAGEYVYNAGLVAATGHAGIYLNNTGSVKDTGTIKASSPAIELYGGGNVTITNTGLATSSAKSAIYLKQSGTVTNAGIIIGSGPGIQMADGGTVLNTGSITGKAGIAVTLAAGYVLNEKFVDGTINTGIYLQDGGSIINTGFAEGVNHGIEIFSGTGFATNTGTIIGATGALFLGGGTLTDSGTIIGTTGDAVSFASGFTNRLILDPGAVLTGTANLGGGTLELASAATTGTISGLGAQFINATAITIDTGAHWTITGPATIANGETLTDYGAITFTGAVTNNGLMIADPAIIIYESAVTGTGTIDVSAGDTIIFQGSVSSTETIDFLSPAGTIISTDPSQFNATVIGTGTEIFACFGAGTHILTPRGEIAVENLREGDLVITTEGDDAPIKWIGHRTIDLTKIKTPQKAQPIRISANAIADGIPARDLYLSPDHALYFENHLIPAKALLNNRNVTQLQKAKITYYHIELATHAAIFAEHTPCETYLETGNRSCFENAPITTLHPDFNPESWQAQREATSFAPFTESGPAANALRNKLLDRAFNTQKSHRRAAP